jgi:hypothetical protein
MGNTQTIQKCNFEDVQHILTHKSGILINTLPRNTQDFLIENTTPIQVEEGMINDLLNTNKQKIIIVYGKNYTDDTVVKKYEQLLQLGFVNVYIYSGGLFEWMCLQDIYGTEDFPSTIKDLDILRFKPHSAFQKKIKNI